MADELDRLYERVLILRCQTGDGAAFAEIVGRYGGRLEGYLRKLLGDTAATADALQDVWLAVWRGLPRLADRGAFEAWAFRIARDRAFRELRRRGLPTVPADDALADDRPDPLPADDAAAVRAALDRLSPHHRDILMLRYVEGLSYEQVAAVVGVPVGTVRSRLHHAKRLARDIHQPEGER